MLLETTTAMMLVLLFDLFGKKEHFAVELIVDHYFTFSHLILVSVHVGIVLVLVPQVSILALTCQSRVVVVLGEVAGVLSLAVLVLIVLFLFDVLWDAHDPGAIVRVDPLLLSLVQ